MFEQGQAQRTIRSSDRDPNAPTPRETVMATIEQVIAHQCAAHELVARIESAIGLPGEPPDVADEKRAGIGHGARR